MSQRFVIPNGQALTATMSSDFAGGVLAFSFTGTPVGIPRVFRLFAGSEIEVPQFGKNEWRFNGACERVRIDLTGVTGYTAYSATCWRSGSPVPIEPEGISAGTRALVSQGYNEANVKNGLQYYARVAWPTATPIANGAAGARKLLFVTGAKPVIFKGRVFDYIGEELTIQLFEGPTGVAGGTPVTVRNFNRINPVASTMQVTRDVTTTSDGTAFDDPEYFFGSTNAPQRQATSIPSGRERVLKPNTSYLVVITSVIGTARAQYFGDWYEGVPDLPLTL